MILGLIEEAMTAGCTQKEACKMVGIPPRTLQRWRRGPGDDLRSGPRTKPANALSKAERARVLEVVNSPEFRDLSPTQIVPKLADRGEYIASESTMHRILREEDQLSHRGKARPPTSRRPDEHVATGPNQVWSWDITYLRSALAGTFFYLYLIMDVWSRKIVGFEVHEQESPDLAAELAERTCNALGVDGHGIVLHSDNGGPMKGATMLATLERLGVMPSFSRPKVSDDNPYSEALFRTMKYCPSYPSRPFESLEHARGWVEAFVRWYNSEHCHSGIRYVTPEQRHEGDELAILENRRRVYEQARARNPRRWTKQLRNWNPIEVVALNPKPRAKEVTKLELHTRAKAAA